MTQYHLARDGTQLGVLTENEIAAGLASGRVLSNDLMWCEGMPDWQPVGTRFQTPGIVGAGAVMPGAGGFNPYAAPVANVTVQKAHSHLELASLGKRFGAAVLDGVAAAVLVGIPYGILMARVGHDAYDSPANEQTLIWAGAFMGLGFVVLAVVNIVMLTTRGQSIGKRLMGIRIVTHPDGQKPGFVKAVLLRSFVNSLIGAVPCLGGLYALVDVCFIFQEDRRCIHDQIAGTQVVEGNPPVG